MIRIWCAHCGADMDEGRRACGCTTPMATRTEGEPARIELHVRRYAALRMIGLSHRATDRLAPPDRVPS